MHFLLPICGKLTPTSASDFFCNWTTLNRKVNDLLSIKTHAIILNDHLLCVAITFWFDNFQSEFLNPKHQPIAEKTTPIKWLDFYQFKNLHFNCHPTSCEIVRKLLISMHHKTPNCPFENGIIAFHTKYVYFPAQNN
jgi:hypothetical protein